MAISQKSLNGESVSFQRVNLVLKTYLIQAYHVSCLMQHFSPGHALKPCRKLVKYANVCTDLI